MKKLSELKNDDLLVISPEGLANGEKKEKSPNKNNCKWLVVESTNVADITLNFENFKILKPV